MGTGDETLIRNYLLGEVAEEDRSLIEQRLLTDKQYYNQLLRIEEELIDEYVSTGLNNRDKQRFERLFLNAPERREEVEFARVFNKFVSAEAIWDPGKPSSIRTRAGVRSAATPPVSRSRPAIEAALMAAALLLAAAAIWLVIERGQLRRQIDEIRAERDAFLQHDQELTEQLAGQRSRADNIARQLEGDHNKLVQMEQQLAKLQQGTGRGEPGSSLVALALSPGLSRTGGHTGTVTLREGAQRLRLHLELEDASFRSYRVEIQTVEGGVVQSWSGLSATRARGGKAIEVTAPVARITRSDYLVALSGVKADGTAERIATYYFRVVRK